MGQGAKEGDWAAGGHTGLSQIGVVFHRFHLPGAKHAKVGGSGGGASHGDGADEPSCSIGGNWGVGHEELEAQTCSADPHLAVCLVSLIRAAHPNMNMNTSSREVRRDVRPRVCVTRLA